MKDEKRNEFENRFSKIICGVTALFKWVIHHSNSIIAICTIILVLVGLGALWVARDSEKRQLRAYVYVIPAISNFIPGQHPVISFDIKNGGLTPAYNC